MLNCINSISEFEYFIYGLPQKYSDIKISKVVLKRLGRAIGEVVGSIEFPNDIVLKVQERIDFYDNTIESYSYEVYKGTNILYWYDPQPHPDDPTLTSTFPHHKHIPPDIKHHRVVAPGLSYNPTNSPFLIEKII